MGRCACDEVVRLAEAEGRAAKRPQGPARTRRARCACREATRLGEQSELRSSRKAPRECREVPAEAGEAVEEAELEEVADAEVGEGAEVGRQPVVICAPQTHGT